MSSWSLCMIVKNEEDVLERCLNSVRELVDEIIIVDTGSEDGRNKPRNDLRIRFMIFNGGMTSQPQEIFLLPGHRETT